MPPPRLTLAAELRGASPMYNGHLILANNATASSPAGNGDGECPNIQHDESESLIDLT